MVRELVFVRETTQFSCSETRRAAQAARLFSNKVRLIHVGIAFYAGGGGFSHLRNGFLLVVMSHHLGAIIFGGFIVIAMNDHFGRAVLLLGRLR